MATKTITIELDAYDALTRARLHPRESFSEVVRRARWDDKQHTARALLAFVEQRSRAREVLDDAALQALTAHDVSEARVSPRTKR